jgi:hypothetical protein
MPPRRWIRAHAEKMRSLMVEPKRVERRHKPAPMSVYDGECFLSNRARQCVRQRVSEKHSNAIGITRDQRTTERIEEGEHRASSRVW